jgi:hypothetical protein
MYPPVIKRGSGKFVIDVFLRLNITGWFGTFFIFPYLGNVIIPIDELVFFRRGRYTTNQL